MKGFQILGLVTTVTKGIYVPIWPVTVGVNNWGLHFSQTQPTTAAFWKSLFNGCESMLSTINSCYKQQQFRNPDRNIRPPTSMNLLITVQVIELQSIKNFIPRMNVYYYKFYFTFRWAFFLFIWIFFFSGIFFFHGNFFSPSFTFWFNRLWCRCHN